MKFTASALLLILSAVASASAEDAAADAGAKKPVGRMMVNKYDGPDDCADDEKVQAGQFLSMHYTGTIHSSSATGEQGKQFDSSRDRGETFDFQVGVGQVIQGAYWIYCTVLYCTVLSVCVNCVWGVVVAVASVFVSAFVLFNRRRTVEQCASLDR